MSDRHSHNGCHPTCPQLNRNKIFVNSHIYKHEYTHIPTYVCMHTVILVIEKISLSTWHQGDGDRRHTLFPRINWLYQICLSNIYNLCKRYGYILHCLHMMHVCELLPVLNMGRVVSLDRMRASICSKFEVICKEENVDKKWMYHVPHVKD